MISWDLLNNIIESRVQVPWNTNLFPANEQEREEIAMYEKIKIDAFSIEPNWMKEDLFQVCERAKSFLESKYEQLSKESVDKIVNYLAYCLR